MALIYEDKTEILRRCFFDVQNEVGLGRQEEDYHSGCKVWLSDHDVPFTSKHPHPVLFQGQVAHTLHPDLVAWDSITVELKAMPRSPRETEFVQLFDYLKCRNDRLGLLVNIGLDRVHVERVVYEKPETRLEENWKYWSGRISGRARNVGISIRDALRAVYHEHETGYGAEVTEKLILFVLQTYRLKVTLRPVATAYYHGIELHHSPLECLVIEDVPLESSLAADYQQQLDDRAATLDETAIGDRVFPHFIAKHLPLGLTGLLIAAVFAAAMSTVSTSLNSSATLLMTDDYRRFFNPQASERQCLLALYASTIVWGALGDGMDKLLPRLHGPRRRHARDSPGWRAHQSLSSWHQRRPKEGLPDA